MCEFVCPRCVAVGYADRVACECALFEGEAPNEQHFDSSFCTPEMLRWMTGADGAPSDLESADFCRFGVTGFKRRDMDVSTHCGLVVDVSSHRSTFA